MNATAVLSLVLAWVLLAMTLLALWRFDRDDQRRRQEDAARVLGGTMRSCSRNRDGRRV